jgi:hypothetical protein
MKKLIREMAKWCAECRLQAADDQLQPRAGGQVAGQQGAVHARLLAHHPEALGPIARQLLEHLVAQVDPPLNLMAIPPLLETGSRSIQPATRR